MAGHNAEDSPNLENVLGPPDEPDRMLPPKFDHLNPSYDMSGDKLLVIFNHYRFQDSRFFRSKPRDRDGTENDVNRLDKSFRKRQFKVYKRYQDLTHDEILIQTRIICSMDHSSTSCLAIVILTHGEQNGMLCAADRLYPMSDVINLVMHENGLAGKPKLFFIQACRGGNVDEGHKVMTDSGEIVRIPTHADCLIIRSSIEGYQSYRRDREGSWLIQALCDLLDDHDSSTVNILSILTLVNFKVSQRATSNSDVYLNNKKQIPEIVMTLTKFLYF